MRQINYVINGKDYLDATMLRNELKITKSQFQYLERTYPFPTDEVQVYQNKKLYSIEGITSYLEKLLEIEVLKEELKEKIKWQ